MLLFALINKNFSSFLLSSSLLFLFAQYFAHFPAMEQKETDNTLHRIMVGLSEGEKNLILSIPALKLEKGKVEEVAKGNKVNQKKGANRSGSSLNRK